MIEKEAYGFTSEYVGLMEVKGKADNPMIVDGHRLTHIIGMSPVQFGDEIPWCSSWMNLAIMCSNIRRNPQGAFNYLKSLRADDLLITRLFGYAKVSMMNRQDTGKRMARITESASAASWKDWGVSVPFDQARRGDVCVLKREGGHHVAFLDEDTMGKMFIRLLGGNQGDQICSKQFIKTRLITVRRSMV